MTATTRTRSAAGAGEDRRALLAVLLSCAVLATVAIGLELARLEPTAAAPGATP